MTLGQVRWFIPLLFCAACAIPEPPSGGPEDRTAPTVASTIPAGDSAGVDASSEIRIEFSEKMTRRNLERSVTFLPPVRIDRASWKDNTISIKPAEPLHQDTTYLVEILPGISDAHGVRTTRRFRFAFATSTAIDSGTISGTVRFRRQPSTSARVRLWTVPLDSGFVASAARPQREISTGPEGDYTLGYLANDNQGYVLWSYQDANANGTYDASSEVGALLPDTVYLEPMLAHAKNHNIFIVDPAEPGDVTGTVTNYTEFDSLFVAVTMRELVDSIPNVYYTVADIDGRFTFAPLRGSYQVTAFIDFAPDSLCGPYPCFDDSTQSCAEPCAVYSDTLVIEPGDKVQLKEILLGQPPAEEEE